MKLFHFYRVEDQSGVSGTGPVVEGVQFTNGWCALRWVSPKSSICFYRSLEDVKAIHGHGGKTEIVLHDLEPLRRQNTVASSEQFGIFMEIIERSSSLISASTEMRGRPDELRSEINSIKSLVDR